MTGKIAFRHYSMNQAFTFFHPFKRYGDMTMSQQHTKTKKRIRHNRYLERLAERIRSLKKKKK